MADLRQGTGAASRMADVLLRGVGGRSVLLRMPAAAPAGSDAEQVGLANPTFSDVELAPAVFRRVRARLADGKAAVSELLVSATAVQALVGSLDYDSASVLFAEAVGVVVGGVLMTIESASSAEAFGDPYLYRLVLHGELAFAV